ncbi:hypothetical protein PHLCEN_2v4898 [Hermanssonia centrifuga]|uniref:Uncharacterized protein n=1 Tax=Hermanssonia centrifuga TaxID=98765 RepID=A0A2R6PFZ8_9APHY|nr:hypothetical protein PHLCEN_2v4898 [Hermanssonia centrifuga]
MANVLDRDFTLIKETDHQDNREFLPRKAVSKDISKSRSPTTSCHNVSLDGSDTPAHRSSVPRLSIPADSGSSCKESPLSVKSSSSSVSSDNSSVYSLRLDTGSNCAQDILFEVALEITEEMARLCDVSRPLPTDVSLVTAGLTPSTIGRLRLWLETRFDYHSSVKRLMKDAVTAESLAADVVGE